MPYRGKTKELAYTLANMNVKHGNFLDLVLLLSQYDVTMEKHIQELKKLSANQIKKKKERALAKNDKSMVTFFLR